MDLGVSVICNDDGTSNSSTLRNRLVAGRRWIVGIKTFAMSLFIFAWTLVQLDVDMWVGNTLFGGSFWTEFTVYTAIAVAFPIFSLIGMIREGSLVSHVWFEITWLLGVGSFDIFLIHCMKRQWPQFGFWLDIIDGDPYVTVAVVLYVLTVIAISFDLILSFLWSGLLLKLCAERFRICRNIWIAHAADFLWLDGDISVPSTRNLFLGSPRSHPGCVSTLVAAREWIMGSTVFKTYGNAETTTFCLVRGCSGLIVWAIILGYGTLNCLINPVTQFTAPKGLPVDLLTNGGPNMSAHGKVSGFIRVGTKRIQSPSRNIPDTPDLLQLSCEAIVEGLSVSYTYPLSQEVMECENYCVWVTFQSEEGFFTEYDATWDCGPVWANIPFRSGLSIMETIPPISVEWNSSSFLSGPNQVFLSGLDAIHISDPGMPASSSTKSTQNPNDTPIPGNTFMLTAGRMIRIEVGRRQIYSKKANFGELLGFSQPPDVYLTYPAVTIRTEGISPDPQMNFLTIHPTFGPFTDEIYEEYLSFTVLGGLSKTGGLYTVFDLTFALLFGRSLLSILWGGKFMTPFGALGCMIRGRRFRENLRQSFPGIDGTDPGSRAEATCDFLHEFILDLRPLEIKDVSKMNRDKTANTEEGTELDHVDSRSDTGLRGDTQGQIA